MADDFIQVAPDSTGKKVDNTTVTTGAGSVERQRVSIGDASATNNAAVTAASALKVDGSAVTQPVSGTFWQATQPVSATGLTNIDVALSTRTKPADQQHAIIDSGTVTAVTAITNALPAGANVIGHVIADTGSTTAVTFPTLTKGTQGATGVSTQDLTDAGRNVSNLFMAAPIITTVAEVMQSLTGYKSGAAVGATVTPAVVTAGKTYRITRVTITYWAATVIGGALVRLRANLSGVGVVGSPLVMAWQVGIPAVFTAGSAMTYQFEYPGGLEFAAGTGLAVGVIGEGAVPTTGTITGYVMVSLEGYEY